MRIRDLLLNSDQASLYGKLENPERLVLLGSPARFNLSRNQGDQTDTIKAEAREIIYERESQSIFLNGDARLAQGDNVLHSNNIEYNVKTDRFRTEGQTDVQINVNKEH